MRSGAVCGLMVVVLAAGLGHANPYDGRLLSLKDLKQEAKENGELDAYLMRNGIPDLAESRLLSDRPPWDNHEVTLYYLGTRKEISFARAVVLGKANVSVTRYERELSDADVATLLSVIDTAEIEVDREPSPLEMAAVEGVPVIDDDVYSSVFDADSTDPAVRAEAAADRAEQAADRVEEAADKAETAALRAEKAFDRLAAAVQARTRRR